MLRRLLVTAVLVAINLWQWWASWVWLVVFGGTFFLPEIVGRPIAGLLAVVALLYFILETWIIYNLRKGVDLLDLSPNFPFD